MEKIHCLEKTTGLLKTAGEQSNCFSLSFALILICKIFIFSIKNIICSWGNGGYVKFEAGRDLCGIESRVIAPVM